MTRLQFPNKWRVSVQHSQNINVKNIKKNHRKKRIIKTHIEGFLLRILGPKISDDSDLYSGLVVTK